MSTNPKGYMPPVIDTAVYLLLSQVPRTFVTEYGIPAAAVPSYRQFNYAAVAMRIPTEMIGKRCFVRRADIPAIIRHFGMTSTVDASFQTASAA
jgi:hypothetical protein